MPRRCGGTFTLPFESKSRVLPLWMRPRSGVTSPATMLTTEVLPEPEGPNSAVTPPVASNFAVIVKSPSRFSTSTASILFPVEARAGAPREPFGKNQCDERDDDRDDDKPPGCRVRVGNLSVGIDRGRDGLCFARNVRDKRDRGAELAEGLGETQHHAGNDAGKRERQCHGGEHQKSVCAERPSRVLELRVDGLDREPDRPYQQGKAHHAAGQRRAGPAEREHDAEPISEKGADHAAPAEPDQQQISGYDGWQA